MSGRSTSCICVRSNAVRNRSRSRVLIEGSRYSLTLPRLDARAGANEAVADPGHVNHLHHHTPVASCDHPTTRAPRQLVARLNIKHQSIWGASHAHQMEALQTDEQITPITTIKRRTAAAGRVRHCRGPLKIAGVEVRSSSRTSTSTRNPRSTPGHPHSTRKSPFRYLLS